MVRQLIVWKDFLTAGTENSIVLYNTEGEELRYFSVGTNGMVDSLDIWHTLGPGI